MSLKRQQEILSGFSMASMTDVVFLLLVFFMVTSTFVFPTALEVNLPQSSEQTPLKPVTRVFIQADGSLWGQFGDGEPMAMPSQQALVDFLKGVKEQAPRPPLPFSAIRQCPMAMSLRFSISGLPTT